MTATIELTSARRKLENALGDTLKPQYFAHLRTWFRKGCTKEELDIEAKKLLSEQFHFHNEFLLAILNKCQTLANFTLMTSPSVKSATGAVLSPTTSIGSPHRLPLLDVDNGRLRVGSIKKSSKISRPSFDQRFSPSHSPDSLPIVDEFEPYDPDERNLMYAFREPTLPDQALVGGRLLIAAWDEGLDGSVNDPAATELIVAAVDQLLKNIIKSLLMDRSAFKLRANKTPYDIGSATANPYLITKQRSMESSELSAANGEESVHGRESEQIWELACSHREASQDQASRIISLFDLLNTLKKHRTSLIPSHSVFSINMERLLCRIHHEGHND